VAYEELASVGEAVDLVPGRVLDEAEALLARLGGHTVLRRTETTLTAKRELPPGARRKATPGLLVLTVAAVPVASGGVRVSVRGNDPDGMRERRAEWAAWAANLPRRSEPRAVAALQTGEGPVSPRASVRARFARAIASGEAAPPAPPPQAPVSSPAHPAEGVVVEDPTPSEGFPEAPGRRHERRDPRAPRPERYEYRVVTLPAVVEAAREGREWSTDPEGDEAAARLQGVIDEYAANGWEFQGVQSVGVGRGRGRLGGAFGGDRRPAARDVAIFRRGAR